MLVSLMYLASLHSTRNTVSCVLVNTPNPFARLPSSHRAKIGGDNKTRKSYATTHTLFPFGFWILVQTSTPCRKQFWA